MSALLENHANNSQTRKKLATKERKKKKLRERERSEESKIFCLKLKERVLKQVHPRTNTAV